jgi:hypothetical protein
MATRRWHHSTADIEVIVASYSVKFFAVRGSSQNCATILGRENAQQFLPTHARRTWWMPQNVAILVEHHKIYQTRRMSRKIIFREEEKETHDHSLFVAWCMAGDKEMVVPTLFRRRRLVVVFCSRNQYSIYVLHDRTRKKLNFFPFVFSCRNGRNKKIFQLLRP